MCCNRPSGRSVELEALAAHESAEIGPLGHRILPGLVLRPAVLGALAELLRVALRAVRLHRLAPCVVGGNLLLEPAPIVTVAVDRDVEPKPWTHDPCEGRPAGAQGRHRKNVG